jgi:hypothetical protein
MRGLQSESDDGQLIWQERTECLLRLSAVVYWKTAATALAKPRGDSVPKKRQSPIAGARFRQQKARLGPPRRVAASTPSARGLYSVVVPDHPYEPCLPTVATKVPIGPEWLHELKRDGFRLIVYHER